MMHVHDKIQYFTYSMHYEMRSNTEMHSGNHCGMQNVVIDGCWVLRLFSSLNQDSSNIFDKNKDTPVELFFICNVKKGKLDIFRLNIVHEKQLPDFCLLWYHGKLYFVHRHVAKGLYHKTVYRVRKYVQRIKSTMGGGDRFVSFLARKWTSDHQNIFVYGIKIFLHTYIHRVLL